MPPKADDVDAIEPTAVLTLQDWLKLLSGRGVQMRVAMALASKIYNSHNTKERLATLDAKKLTPHIHDKEQRRTVVNAVKGIASGQSKAKKRTKDSDLMQPLPTSAEIDVAASLEIKEITDPEVLIPVSITTNRAPVKTAWAFVVCERLGFDRQEALSLAHVFVHFSSLKHALMLGNILNKQETREAEEEMAELPDGAKWIKKKPEIAWNKRKRGREDEKEAEAMQSSQPWVGLLRAKIPVIERHDGTWRAIEKGLPVQPSQAFLYFTKAFKDYTPHVIGAMRLVAHSYEPEELNRYGMGMYNEFKPDVVEWGQKGFLQCSKILDQAKGPVTLPSEGPPEDLDLSPSRPPIKPVMSGGDIGLTDEHEVGSPLSDLPDQEDDQVPKRTKVEGPGMSLEEYEAMLDAEDGEGGFLEGGDILEAVDRT